MVYHLEQSVEELKECSKNREAYNPLVYIAQLGLGVLASLVSLLWVAPVVLYILVNAPPLSLMLNAFLIQARERKRERPCSVSRQERPLP